MKIAIRNKQKNFLLEKSIKPLTSKKGVVTFEVPKKVAKKKGKLTLRLGTDTDYVIYKLK